MNSAKQIMLLLIVVLISMFNWTNAGTLKVEAEAKSNCELQFRPCSDVKNPVGKLNKATFNGTCNGPIAILHRGTKVTISFSFESDTTATALTSKVCGKLQLIPTCIPFPLTQPDACKAPGMKCPVPAHHEASFGALLDVKSFYPKVNVFVRWELKDQDGKDVFCGEVPATLV